MSERKALASQRTNGGKSNLPHALSVSWNSIQDRHQCAQAEERANKMSIIAKHPRAAHERRLAARDRTSESDEGESEGADWDECYGVRLSPANHRYVGRGDSTCGGESWCIQYLRSKYFFVLNQTMHSVG